MVRAHHDVTGFELELREFFEEPGGEILVNAKHRDEVALLSGPAAAINKYENAPHDAMTLHQQRNDRQTIAKTRCHIMR